MKRPWMAMAAAALCTSLAAIPARAQDSSGSGQGATSSDPEHWYSPARFKKLNPVPYVKKPIDYLRSDSKTASGQLAANSDEDRHLTAQLQSHDLLPSHTDLKKTCFDFKALEDCVAALHASHNVGIKFDCLTWNMTAVAPDGAAKICTKPESNRQVTLERAIHALKPDADAREEAKTALRQARENIADAK